MGEYADLAREQEENADFGMFRNRDFANRLLREHVSDKLRQTFAAATKKRSEKNRDIEWTTGQGEVLRLEQMEDSHLLNTVAYINRKLDEYNKVAAMAHARNQTVPQYMINKASGTFWIDAMLKELNRREQKKIADAKKVLGVE